MVNKVSLARTVDQVLMVYQVNKVRWAIKENQASADHLATMDQEDLPVNVGSQDCPDLTVKASKVKRDKKVRRDQLVNLVKTVGKDQKVNQRLSISEMLLDLLVRGVLSVHPVFLARMVSLEKLVNLVLMDFLVKKVQRDREANLAYPANRFPVPKVTMVRKANKVILVSKENPASKEKQGCPDQEVNKDKRESPDCQIPVFPDVTESLVYQAKMVALENLVLKVRKAKTDRKVSEVDPVQLVK